MVKFEEEFRKTRWSKKYKTGFYFFTPKSIQALITYGNFWGVDEIFREWLSGIETARDHFVVGFSIEEIVQRLQMFKGDLPDDIVKQRLKLKDTGSWKVSEIRQKIKAKDLEKGFYPYAYRPFDVRWICYEPILIHRSRLPFMNNLKNENIALLCMREVVIESGFSHTYVLEKIFDRRFFLSNRGAPYFFPLYLYPNEPKIRQLGEQASKQKRTPNFSEEFLQAVNEALGTEPTPGEIFYYIYAVLYSPTYRKRYDEFLKFDFPRIPLPEDYEKFKKLSELGKELVELHLLKHPALQELDSEI